MARIPEKKSESPKPAPARGVTVDRNLVMKLKKISKRKKVSKKQEEKKRRSSSIVVPKLKNTLASELRAHHVLNVYSAEKPKIPEALRRVNYSQEMKKLPLSPVRSAGSVSVVELHDDLLGMLIDRNKRKY